MDEGDSGIDLPEGEESNSEEVGDLHLEDLGWEVDRSVERGERQGGIDVSELKLRMRKKRSQFVGRLVLFIFISRRKHFSSSSFVDKRVPIFSLTTATMGFQRTEGMKPSHPTDALPWRTRLRIPSVTSCTCVNLTCTIMSDLEL